MASERNEGGPAFGFVTMPDPEDPTKVKPTGMSLHDWFAGQALCSIGLGMMQSGMDDRRPVAEIYARLAQASYSIADAMISERSK